MKAISKIRFDAIAGYARQPTAALIGRELEYFESGNGSILGLLVEDLEDGDYLGLIFAPDARLRYRSAGMTAFVRDVDTAREQLHQALAAAERVPAHEHFQGDEQGEPIDFFTPVRPPDKLHPDFSQLLDQESYSPAIDIIAPMMRWYDDVDGNFIEQFQTTGFDQRIWELYLFAMLIENGFRLDRSDPVPDFDCTSLHGSLTMEAVTVGPTRKGDVIIPPPPRETEEEQHRYRCEYMPIKFGSALFSKLNKRYWERPNVAGRPFVLAIADFSEPGSMIHTRSSLERYLYGFDVTIVPGEGALNWSVQSIDTHSFGEKTIPSGFFRLPGSENVSAVISSTAGTIAKFGRMGLQAGFGTGRVLMIRDGTAVDHDPSAPFPKRFRAIVNAPGYSESWTEGMSVYHNPSALYPLDPALFPEASHHFLEDGPRLRSFTPDFFPFGSFTRQYAPVDVEALLAEAGENTHIMWTLREDADHGPTPP